MRLFLLERLLKIIGMCLSLLSVVCFILLCYEVYFILLCYEVYIFNVDILMRSIKIMSKGRDIRLIYNRSS